MVEFQAPRLNFFSAEFSFRSKVGMWSKPLGPSGSYENKTTVDFTALNEQQAVESAALFWQNRSKTIPYYYGEIMAMAVFKKSVGPIKPDGTLASGAGFAFFEWKEDHPEDLEDAIFAFTNKNKGLAEKAS